MSEINIRRPHTLAPEAARRLAEAMAARLNERFDLICRWDGDALRFGRAGVEGVLTIGEREIRIEARLGFLLALAQTRIEREIHASLDDVLGTDAGSSPGSSA